VVRLGEFDDKPTKGHFPITPYKMTVGILGTRTLSGNVAKEVCDLWRSQRFAERSMSCHFPVYGLRFFQGEKLHFETSICWGCRNFSTEGGWASFSSTNAAGKALYSKLNEILPKE
jgi:hypothetical protein